MRRELKLAALFVGLVTMIWLAVSPTPVHAVVAANVQVVNPDSSSIPTHDAAPPQPVTGFCETSSGSGSDCLIYTVPSGKRLVVEQFSYEISASFSIAPILVRAEGTTAFSFPPAFGGCDSGGTCIYADTRSVRLYLDEGQGLSGVAFFSAANTFPVTYHFSGFLSNK